MAKVSLTIIPSRPNRHGECAVMLQISAFRRTIRVPTDVTVEKDNWINEEEKIKGGKDGDSKAASKNVRITQIKNACEVKMINNQVKVDQMNVQTLKKFLLSEAEVVETNFFSYASKILDHYKSLGRKKSASLMETTLAKMKDYNGNGMLEFGDITVRYLEKLEAWCLQCPIKVHGKKNKEEITRTMGVNGVAVYLRNIRTLLNHAISDDLTDNYPFKKFKIKTEDTRNRNLTTDAIRAIRDYKPDDRREEISADFFMLQFYLQGINLYDLFWMTPDKVINKRLQYNRAKTGRFHNVKIEPEAQKLIDKYRGEKYWLWFADQCGKERQGQLSSKHARKSPFQYKDEAAFTKMINSKLSKIQTKFEIRPEVKITSYYCRHSFASILREINVSIDDINLCMGHRDPDRKVTGIYIDELWIKADEANRKLLDHLKKDHSEKEISTKKKSTVREKQAL